MEAPTTIAGAVFWVLGGLALFLYGIDLMGKALRKAAGIALRQGLDRLTRTRFHGLLTGTAITALVNSSSATTVMVVGFIGAGLLTFPKSIGIILGANIGACLITQLTAFNLGGYSLPILGVGFLLNAFSKKRVLRQVGTAVMGFGMLFFGLELMKFAISGYTDSIKQLINIGTGGGIASYLPGFLISVAITAIIQSSGATIILVQALATQGAISGIDTAIPMIVGARVGTCITAILASMTASRSAKKAAVAHLVFNIASVLITALAFKLFVVLIPKTSPDLGRQVANAQLAIKLVSVGVFLPFTVGFAKLVTRMLPGEDKISSMPKFLDYDLVKNPNAALTCARKEISRMFDKSVTMVHDAIEAFLAADEVSEEEIFKKEEMIDDLNATVADYMVRVSRGDLSPEQKTLPPFLLSVMHDTERIADHAENIVELSAAYTRKDAQSSAPAVKEIREISGLIKTMGDHVLKMLGGPSFDLTADVLELRNQSGSMITGYLAAHQDRLADGTCSVTGGIVHAELLTNLTSVIEHMSKISANIADNICEK